MWGYSLLFLYLLVTGILAASINLSPESVTFTWIIGEPQAQPTSQLVRLNVVPPSSDATGWWVNPYPEWVTVNPRRANFVNGRYSVQVLLSTSTAPQQPGNYTQLVRFQFTDSTGQGQFHVYLNAIAPTPCNERLNCTTCLDQPDCGFCLTTNLCTNSSSNCSDYYPSQCPIPCNGNCSGHGTCDQHSGTCGCNSDYFGNTCDIYCSPSTNCSSNGTCTTSGSCDCDTNYYGNDCSIYCNSNSTCSGRGSCDFFKNGTCHCNYPAYGNSCQFTYCPDSCNGNGSCNNNTGMCTCNENYFSPNCGVFCSANTTCSAHGSCAPTSGACNCDASYYGNSCATYCDNATTCSSHGFCAPGSGACECDPAYFSANCSVFCDVNATCGNNGVCSQNGTCNCTAPFFGDACQFKNCDGYAQNKTCNLHGTCNTTNGLCACETDYNCQESTNVPMEVTTTCYPCKKKQIWSKYHLYFIIGGSVAAAIVAISLICYVQRKRKMQYEQLK